MIDYEADFKRLLQLTYDTALRHGYTRAQWNKFMRDSFHRLLTHRPLRGVGRIEFTNAVGVATWEQDYNAFVDYLPEFARVTGFCGTWDTYVAQWEEALGRPLQHRRVQRNVWVVATGNGERMERWLVGECHGPAPTADGKVQIRSAAARYLHCAPEEVTIVSMSLNPR